MVLLYFHFLPYHTLVLSGYGWMGDMPKINSNNNNKISFIHAKSILHTVLYILLIIRCTVVR
jgi:hypothetical protein